MVKDTSLSSRVLDIIIHVSLALVLLVTLFPILHIASVSLSSDNAFFQGKVSFFPRELTFSAYQIIIKSGTVPTGMKNSFLYTSVGTVINMLLTTTMAYALSKKRLTFRGFYTVIVVITMFFSGGLIPTFLVVKGLKQYNTLWALVLPGAIAPWYLIIMRTFFQSIPDEIEESAFIDGANDIRILLKLILPLAKASIATIGLFYLVGHWNSWFNALIYLKDQKRFPLQLVLRNIVMQNMVQHEMVLFEEYRRSQDEIKNIDAIKYGTLFVSIMPMMVIYPFIQRYFVKGIMIGSLKG